MVSYLMEDKPLVFVGEKREKFVFVNPFLELS